MRGMPRRPNSARNRLLLTWSVPPQKLCCGKATCPTPVLRSFQNHWHVFFAVELIRIDLPEVITRCSFGKRLAHLRLLRPESVLITLIPGTNDDNLLLRVLFLLKPSERSESAVDRMALWRRHRCGRLTRPFDDNNLMRPAIDASQVVTDERLAIEHNHAESYGGVRVLHLLSDIDALPVRSSWALQRRFQRSIDPHYDQGIPEFWRVGTRGGIAAAALTRTGAAVPGEPTATPTARNSDTEGQSDERGDDDSQAPNITIAQYPGRGDKYDEIQGPLGDETI